MVGSASEGVVYEYGWGEFRGEGGEGQHIIIFNISKALSKVRRFLVWVVMDWDA